MRDQAIRVLELVKARRICFIAQFAKLRSCLEVMCAQDGQAVRPQSHRPAFCAPAAFPFPSLHSLTLPTGVNLHIAYCSSI